jgi:hypothetical protein
MDVVYEVWDDNLGGYIYTKMFQCLESTKSGDRCLRHVSGRLFCPVHRQQEKRLDHECQEFFKPDNPGFRLEF